MTDPSDERAVPAPRRGANEFEAAFRPRMLHEYLWSNRDGFTEAALAAAAQAAGYSTEEITTAAAGVAKRRLDEAAAKPVKARARWYIFAAYGIVFVAFAIVFLQPAASRAMFVGGGVLLGILAVAMLIALWLGLAWVASRHPAEEGAKAALGVMLAVPFVLLIVVAGLCAVTTSPLIFAPGV